MKENFHRKKAKIFVRIFDFANFFSRKWIKQKKCKNDAKFCENNFHEKLLREKMRKIISRKKCLPPWHCQKFWRIPLKIAYVFWQSCPSWQVSSPLVDGIKRWTSGLADTDQSTEFPVETTLNRLFVIIIKIRRNRL